MMLDRPSALDALFLYLEDSRVGLHIAATAVFEGPVPDDEQIRARWTQLTTTDPRYRQVLRRTVLDLRRPRWVERGGFDIDYHLRRTALPAPGGTAQLERTVGQLVSQRLDPDRPLWESCTIEGLQGGRWAVLVKVHHSLVDGLGGMALLARLLDAGHPAPPPPPSAALLRRVLAAAAAPPRVAAALAGSAGGLLRYATSLWPTDPTSLTGPLGRARRYRTLTVDCADVRTVRAALGGTVNDVVLTMVANAFRTLLTERGERPGTHAVRCLVPVATRTAAQADEGANRVSVVLVHLPVDCGDPATVHAVIRARMTAAKTSGEAAAGERGFAAADLVPAPVFAAAVGALRRIPQRVVTTVTTNVPGPRAPQTLLGRPMVALFPFVPIADRIRVSVAVSSYVDHLHFGITCDRATVPDADVFVAGLAAGLAGLVTAAAG
ncbi:MAG: wax ester/triacylglycerol synthase family O-acyltransferase [Jatrophihabitans sp.]|nr:MAG: wax ester/triacylglycerol synthase family O-acyltransferase [Jatrophihabitans sp.]